MGKIELSTSRCKGCGYCISVCPTKAISKTNIKNSKGYNVVAVDCDKCIQCGSCYTVCPDYVFTVYGR